MSYKAVLFDVDGTIVMSEMRNRNVIENLAKQHGGVIQPQDWQHLAGQPEKDIWQWLKNRHPALGIEQDDFVSECRSGYLKSTFNLMARPGIKEAIDYFKSKGLRVAAVSNSPRAIIEHGLKAVGCFDDMEFIISAVEEAPRAKPHPDAFLMAIAKMAQTDPAITAANTIIFEDSGTGITAGYESGCLVVQLVDFGNAPNAKAAAHVHDEEELRDICRTLVPKNPSPIGLIADNAP